MNMNFPARSTSSSDGYPSLCPTQQSVYEQLSRTLDVAPIVGLVGAAGLGCTSILRRLAAEHDGQVISASDVVGAARGSPGDKWDDAFDALVMDALARHALVIVDDYTELTTISGMAYTRGGYLPNLVGRRICEAAIAMGKKLVFGGKAPEAWQSTSDLYGDKATLVHIPALTADDYEFICGSILGRGRVESVDFKLIFRSASRLSAFRLRLLAQLVSQENAISTDTIIDYLETYVLLSNTRTREVEALEFDSLPGCEHIIEALETNVVLPFENRKLAQELGLKPKRGVLLFGPPGTGKTSIGRALAHRMKGKFFMIDGSFISEPPGVFFNQVQKVVEDAKLSSPSVLFVDDADVLFKIDHIAGVVRYLLSLLDGLESETASNVCVMMTAMDVRKIPDALLRSGRVELWLETKVPDLETRARILRRWMGEDLPHHEDIDYDFLAEATEGFTPADLRRITGDAKSLYAADLVAKQRPARANEYLVAAVNEIVAVRNNMADLLQDDRLRAGRMIGRSKTR